MKGRLLTGFMVALLLVIGSVHGSTPARAYAFLGCHWPSGVYGLQYSDQTPLGYQPSDSANAWTNTPTPVYLIPNAAGPIVIYASYFGNTGWVGISYPVCDGYGNFIDVHDYYNRTYTDSYDESAKQWVMVHELGHALGLAHAGSYPPCFPPIMYSDANDWFVCNENVPQSDDINGINALY